jgi:hypothetical protein
MILEGDNLLMVSPLKSSIFKPVQLRKGFARVGICGVPGSGKTKTALEVACGLGKRIALIDTDDRAWMYQRSYEFERGELVDYAVDSWIEAIYDAEDSGFDVLILDNFSEAWAGLKGLQEYHQSILNENKNVDSFQAWNFVNPLQRKLLDALTMSRLHIVCTFQAKVEYERILRPDGKTAKLTAVGYGPVWRSGIEGKFDFFGQIELENHELRWTKEMFHLFGGETFQCPTAELGARIKAWCDQGEDGWEFKPTHRVRLIELLKKNQWSNQQVAELLEMYEISRFDEVKQYRHYQELRQILSLTAERGFERAEYFTQNKRPTQSKSFLESTGEVE